MRPRREAAARELITLRGLFESFRIHTSTGWGTGVLAPADGGSPVAIKGVVVGGRPGDSVELEGYWQDSPQYGPTFAVVSCTTTAPATAEAVVAWMASKLPGVGDKRAHEMLTHFGGAQALWDVIEREHARLTEVSGITPDRAAAIHAAYTDGRAERDSSVTLKGWGLTDNQIARCKDAWKSTAEVVKRIRENPYALCYLVTGFGFKRADEVAQRIGIAPDAIERVVAGVVYTLETAILDGHCFLWGGQLQREAAEVLDLDPSAVGRGIAEAWRLGHIVRRGKRIYSQRLERAEGDCAQALAALLKEGDEGGKAFIYH
jgi:exodeoxyribonuclease V alpha subunit